MPQLVRIRIRLYCSSTPLSIVFHRCFGSDRAETLIRKVLLRSHYTMFPGIRDPTCHEISKAGGVWRSL